MDISIERYLGTLDILYKPAITEEEARAMCAESGDIATFICTHLNAAVSDALAEYRQHEGTHSSEEAAAD